MIGHNKGPTLERGHGWRRHAWTRARKALIPNTMPLEIVRLRVKRAAALGLDYKTYASIRAASGRDVVAFLFSGNALALTPKRLTLPHHIADKLTPLDAQRLAAIYAPAHPVAVAKANPGLFTHVAAAPPFTESWSATRARLKSLLSTANAPADGTILIAATTIERDWCAAANLAAAIPADRFFTD